MKTIITVALLFITTLGVSQTPYEKGIRKAFQLWEAHKMDEASIFLNVLLLQNKNNGFQIIM